YLSVDRTAAQEGEGPLVYTVTLRDEDGNPVSVQAGHTVTVTTTLGDVIINAGDSSATLVHTVEQNSLFEGERTLVNTITEISQSNAAVTGAFEALDYKAEDLSVTIRRSEEHTSELQ